MIQLYAEMAKLTAPECGKSCGDNVNRDRCCSSDYCEIAIDHAKKNWGVTLTPTGHPRLPLMGEDGCTAPPHLRPICTVHVCTINSLGKKPDDPAWTKRYFRIRNELTDKESTIALDDI